MELLLELRFPSGATAGHSDVSVELDPEDTVAALTEALVAHATPRGYRPNWAGAGLYRGDSPEPLDPASRVVDTGLVSGETVTLTDGPVPSSAGQEPGPGGSRLTLDVTAGPEAGRVIPLPVGTVIIGRAPSCDIVIADPTMSGSTSPST
jgi:S-DNA-T family DNA segregation ATPase FtsK/SpoIIIE